MEDWLKIKTEYITTDTSYRKLAEKYGVHKTRIAEMGKKEGWPELRVQYRDRTVTETVNAIGVQAVDKASRIYDVADKLLIMIEDIVSNADPRRMQAKSIRALVSAVKDLKDIQGVQSDLDLQEQEARIANLRKQVEKDTEQVNEIEVVFSAGEDEWNE